jgi:hypothetical protein
MQLLQSLCDTHFVLHIHLNDYLASMTAIPLVPDEASQDLTGKNQSGTGPLAVQSDLTVPGFGSLLANPILRGG